MTPKWWEVNVVIHDSADLYEEFTSEEEARIYTEGLVQDLREDVDCARWVVFLQPHWCGKKDECKCERVTPFASFEGLTIP